MPEDVFHVKHIQKPENTHDKCHVKVLTFMPSDTSPFTLLLELRITTKESLRWIRRKKKS